jgi:hypothetical protein
MPHSAIKRRELIDTDLDGCGEKVYKIGRITSGTGNVVIKE